MSAFAYTLEREDGTPANPPTLKTAVPNWSVGDTIPLGGRTLRVVRVRVVDPLPKHVLVAMATHRQEQERVRVEAERKAGASRE